MRLDVDTFSVEIALNHISKLFSKKALLVSIRRVLLMDVLRGLGEMILNIF